MVLLYASSLNAQTMFEYWFDNYSDPKTISLKISSGTISPTLDASGLSQGFHTLCMRFKSSDGMYSPVSTSFFFKHTGDGVSKIEYWFEDNVSKMAFSTIDAEKDSTQIIALDLADSEKFPLGVHQLNMRVAIDGGFYSPVYSALVLRMPSGFENSLLEYWFDDDMSKMATIPIDIEKGDVQKLDLDLTNSDYFPSGFHKLNMRVAANGNQYSPIYSAYVMRLPEGLMTELSYWLDDNYEERRILKGRHQTGNGAGGGGTVVYGDEEGGGGGNRSWTPSLTQKHSSGSVFESGMGILYLTSLDLSGASSGMHRLKFRIASNGSDGGVIYETAILVTRRYNNDNLANVTIVTEHHWYDDFYNPQRSIANPQHIYTVSYDLEPALYSGYSEGQHELHVQFKNSAEVWSAENITYFYKDASGRLRVGKMESGTDAIDEMTEVDNVTEVARYDLNGCRLAAPKKGINIVHMSDGSTRKILVK